MRPAPRPGVRVFRRIDMARQITGAKIYLAGGHTLQVGVGPVAELVALLEEQPNEVRRIQIVDGNEVLLHWTQVAALQIFSAGK
jgi:hypothetical protein